MIPHNGFVSNRVLKLNVGFLLTQSLGTSHDVDFDVPALAVAEDLKLAYLKGPLRLSRMREGILVQGQLQTALEGECRRCLTPLAVAITLDIEELYSTHASQSGTSQFWVDDDAILDLTPLLREEAIIGTPLAPLCRPDCAGLCPTCGQNLNEGPCSCGLDNIDPRLAILQQLRNKT